MTELDARLADTDENVLLELIEQARENSRSRKRNDIAIEFHGDKIIIPAGMKPSEAVKWIQDWEAQQNKKVAIFHVFEAYPTDGAYALYRVLKARYGFTSLRDTPTMFGSNPPVMIGVEVGPNEIVQVPWGRIGFPGVDGFVETGFQFVDGKFKFTLNGQVVRKNEDTVTEIISQIKELLKESSIYKRQAIKVRFLHGQDPSYINPIQGELQPKFMDLSGIEKSQLVFNDDVGDLIETAIFTPLEHTQRCRDMKVPLHRGILLEGKYGTGKTLTASVVAKTATENKWTFIYLEDTADLQEALNFAKDYTPAVVFAEDIDRVMGGERDEDMDGILNTISGVNSKDTEIMLVLTTNYVEKINQAMLRPGRLDSVITISPPDAKSAERLIRMYAGAALAENADITEACELLTAQIPAVIREVTERAKIVSVRHDDSGIITADDLRISAMGMKRQLELLAVDRNVGPTYAEQVGNGIAQVFTRLVHSAAQKGNVEINEVPEAGMFRQDATKGR